ncbi:YHS domain-containing protein [Exilibacterium tricleocarpae]|uniref:YHS domain-containing protein n=1 Tax=Exilibacterium tricleocarpae TaxID=2591008 RepID=A0A545T5T4_9GAMM|nr:YHS domain-containing (seleno)protein [Exilibacterium tricleocarpae]TQV72597.1 YHS domain-containing protein [Exilibacterium tricleocarpae]
MYPLDLRRSLLSFLLLFGLAAGAQAADPIYTSWFNNLAIKGYDAVAYFTENAPVKGKKQWQLEWRGAQWRFSSAENLDAFRANPEKYAPQYGGYCAWAVAHDKLAGIDPQQFSVVDGKLYLNYNAQVQNKWLAERDKLIIDADRRWPSVLER